MSVLLLLAAALAGVHAGAVSEARSSGPLSVSPAEVPRPSHIMSRPPARQVDEEPLEPLPLRPAPGPPALPGTISFPNERLKQADDRADTAEDWDWDEMYNGCGSTKNCLGFPAGCSDLKSCRGLVTVQVINGTFRFRMRASDAKWVAVGLGDTNKMYDTSVIECVYDDATGKVNTFLSYTSKQDPRSCTRISLSGVEKAAITLERSKSMDNGLYCEVSRLNRTKPTPPGKDYWLDATPYFLQAASGTKADSDKIRFHGENKAAAARATRLDVYTDTGTASNWPMRLHGALMVLAWMFAATAGTLAARYFKAAWGKATICGKAMWFAWHRGFMVLTVLLHGVAVISALIFLEGWSSSSGLHGILGGVTTGLALLQGLGGLLRPDLDHKYRPIFNWAHRLQGFISHTLAIITIFLAVALPGARLPTYTYYILAAYVVFYIALHAVHSLTEVQSYYFVVIVFGSAVFAITMLILVVIGPGS